MKLRLSRVHFPVTVLGPGRRLGVWFQGCSMGCPGCVSRDTWPKDAGQEIAVHTLLALCRDLAQDLDGVTISGGEPFEQPDALRALLKGLALWRSQRAKPFDILGYSGMSMSRLRSAFSDILEMFDALIPEPFLKSRPLGACWRGSDNQPLFTVSDLGRKVYSNYVHLPPGKKGSFQIGVDGQSIWLIGLPDRGDMQRMQELASEQGLLFGGTSW
ncbi:4Fe-4S cluster-binding domain-containing protein [Fundidesulfovibrio butyratiphilus]